MTRTLNLNTIAKTIEEDTTLSKPLDASGFENDEFNAHYQSLFLESHLEQIHSTYYGQGRWLAIVNKLLTKLLNFLLLIHLSPDQDHYLLLKKTERESAKLQKKTIKANQVGDLENLIPLQPFTVGSKGWCRRIEECKLDGDMDLTTAGFSGTDNGIVQILKGTKDEDNVNGSDTNEADVFKHLNLPRALTLSSKQSINIPAWSLLQIRWPEERGPQKTGTEF
ncbi:hypothetical protein BD408DRAFT_428022 [Parasitella parasitica]|nr:hypothetical protein BD408DRAFT_428022 [Parasitella parasitica]